MGHARFALVCAAVAGTLAQIVYHGGPPGVDLPSHLFQTWLYSHAGFNLWNNYWYAGRYEFVTYSVLYYPVASAIGQALATMIAAAVLAGSFASVSRREWGSAATGPSLSFAATAPVHPHGRRPLPVPGRRGRRRGGARLRPAPLAHRVRAGGPGHARLLAACIRASHGGARSGAAGPAAARRGAAPPSSGVRRGRGRLRHRRPPGARVPVGRLVPVRPDRRGHRVRVLAGRALHHRDRARGRGRCGCSSPATWRSTSSPFS